MSTLEDPFQSARACANSLGSGPTARADARSFMMSLLDLALRLEAEPSHRVELQRFLDETAPLIDRHFAAIMRFFSETASRGETRLSDDPDQWPDMCARRSALAFFVELYANTVVAPNLGSLDGAYLDQLLRAHANEGYLSADEIPEHMPTSHWWWWLPHAPPA